MLNVVPELVKDLFEQLAVEMSKAGILLICSVIGRGSPDGLGLAAMSHPMMPPETNEKLREFVAEILGMRKDGAK